MQDALQRAAAKLLESASPSDLMASANAMSERYRLARQAPGYAGENSSLKLQSACEHLAYIAVRQPATFAALSRVFQTLASAIDVRLFQSVLDAGSGPGSALWALSESFGWEKAVALDADRRWSQLAQTLWQEHPRRFCVDWKVGDLTSYELAADSFDLVMASYSLNEVEGALSCIDRLWAATRQVLVWVEPGRSDCFEKMRAFRERVLQSGDGVVLAPCTGQGRCPFSPAILASFQEPSLDDKNAVEASLDESAWQKLDEEPPGPGWCHFSVRLQRSALHRALKHASLGYEDEKFCYLIVAKKGALDLASPGALTRVMQEPKVRSGHVRLSLCDSHQLFERIVTKSQGERFRAAKRLSWGSLWEPSP